MKNSISIAVLGFLVFVVQEPLSIEGHGRLMEPPSRSSLWRFSEFRKYNLIPNYDDNQLFCGGSQVQHSRNKGKCGECGDPYHVRRPRDNEAGGKYSKGIITRNFNKGQTINVAVEITASHLGHFEFRLCPQNNVKVPVKQKCLDRNLLELADGSGTKYLVTRGSGWYNMSLLLPPNVKCHHCVFQWHYRAANSWGDCGNGTGAVGCGPQETFRGCSDIAIL